MNLKNLKREEINRDTRFANAYQSGILTGLLESVGDVVRLTPRFADASPVATHFLNSSRLPILIAKEIWPMYKNDRQEFILNFVDILHKYRQYYPEIETFIQSVSAGIVHGYKIPLDSALCIAGFQYFDIFSRRQL